MKFKSQLMQRVEKLENHKDVKNHSGLRKQVAGIKKQLIQDEEIDKKYSYVIELMSDGVGYDDAMREAGLMDGYE